MTRRQLVFLILVNALISTVIALAVAFAVDARRPDPEELAALYTPVASAQILVTSTPGPGLIPTFTPVSPDSETQSDNLAGGDAVQGDAGSGADEGEIYVVEAGDSLGRIAGSFGVTLDALMAANQLTNPDFVFVGQRLRIPVGATTSQEAGNATEDSTPAQADVGGVIVNSVSGAGDLATEQILIVNDSDTAFNLQGWILSLDQGSAGGTAGGSTGASNYTFGNLTLFPGGTLRLNSAPGVDTSVDFYWGQADAQLASGTTIVLTNGNGITAHTFSVP